MRYDLDGIQNPIISSMLYAVCMCVCVCVSVSKHLLALNLLMPNQNEDFPYHRILGGVLHVETFRYLITIIIIIIFIETTPVLQAPRGWRPAINKWWWVSAKKQVKLELQFNNFEIQLGQNMDLNPPRVWNLSPLTTKNRSRGWNLTRLEGLGIYIHIYIYQVIYISCEGNMVDVTIIWLNLAEWEERFNLWNKLTSKEMKQKDQLLKIIIKKIFPMDPSSCLEYTSGTISGRLKYLLRRYLDPPRDRSEIVSKGALQRLTANGDTPGLTYFQMTQVPSLKLT